MLTFQGVLSLAREFVRQRYPLVPPVGMVSRYHVRSADGQLLFEMWMWSKHLAQLRTDLPEFVRSEVPIPADADPLELANARKWVGNWKVRFVTSWD
ncbi:MAG TPA: hypothetical protein VHB77_23315, partial [Planctomycetaceae bacterium]|nr:hypothetical protein [Planctomycetaceae bacterium]